MTKAPKGMMGEPFRSCTAFLSFSVDALVRRTGLSIRRSAESCLRSAARFLLAEDLDLVVLVVNVHGEVLELVDYLLKVLRFDLV
jgi:hypothetical protein